jgi:hypothetical protein
MTMTMTIVAEISTRSGTAMLGIILLSLVVYCFSHFNPRFKMRPHWKGGVPITGFGFAATVAFMIIWAVVIAGNFWNVVWIRSYTLLITVTAFCVLLAGWLHDVIRNR